MYEVKFHLDYYYSKLSKGNLKAILIEMAKNCAVHGQCVNKRSIIYERKVSHLNKRVLPAGRMVLHLRKKIVSYPEGGFFIPIRKVNHSSASSIHLRQRGNSLESKRWLIVKKEELHSFMTSSREVLPWNLQFKPFLGKSCLSSILKR